VFKQVFKQFSTKSRIAFALGCLVVCVLLVAMTIRILPDDRATVMDGRAKLCEAIAVSSSQQVERNDWKGLESNLQAVVTHNPDILSAAARRLDGKCVVQVGDHSMWQPITDGISTDTQIPVPLYTRVGKWGHIELRFRPVSPDGVVGVLNDSRLRLVSFVAAATLLVFYFYLDRVLEQINPSKAVPRHVRSALNTLAEGLLVLDRSERIVLANDAIASVLGRPAEELAGLRASKLPWRLPESDGPAIYPWTQALQEQRPQFNVMIHLQTTTGEEKIYFVNCSPVLGHDGKYGGVLASFDDVTQLEENKRELRKSKEEAESANRAKSEFLARMSHEIRTPMNAILGFTDVLRRGLGGDAEERQEYLNTIYSSGQHLLNLINDILDLSKVEAGKLEVELVRSSLVQIVHEVVAVLRVRAQEKRLTLESVVASPLPESIMTDAVRLRQILMNLVGNAIKFTEHGGVKIVTRFVPSESEPQIVIQVIDTGIGIARESLPKIFDPFTQADTSITRRFGGTGLGLTICRRFAEALGGHLSVESEPGVGSVFTLKLDPGPLDGVRLLEANAAGRPARSAAESSSAELRLPHARLLVVDDGNENRKLLTLLLSRAGATVEAATDGQIAVDMVAAAGEPGFDIILMDVEMPVMDGYTAVQTLRARGVTTPIFALTAHAMKGDEDKCRRAGFSGYLSKPIDIDLLLRTLADELGSRTQQPLAATDPSTPQVESNVGVEAGKSPSEPTATTADVAHDVVGSAACMPHHESMPPSADAAESQATDSAGPADDRNGKRTLVSTLPIDDPEFFAIVEEFVERLEVQLAAMRTAWEGHNLAELARLAHWLKGSGGTAGFSAFTAPAAQLDRCSRQNDTAPIPALLDELHALAASIVLEPAALSAS
jgi:PAS domain S-box-containing protein